MYDSQIGNNVRLSFKALASQPDRFTNADAELLRRRIELAVDDLKSMGWPIEKVVVRIKELASEVGLRLGSNPHQADRHPVLARAVLWSVQRYYADELRR